MRKKRMLSKEEQKELENLKKDQDVRLAMRHISRQLQKNVDKEKKKLYQYRWLKHKGEQLRKNLNETISFVSNEN